MDEIAKTVELSLLLGRVHADRRLALIQLERPLKDSHPRRSRWQLTQDAFDALLRRLDDNRERAGQRFEELRHILLQFFCYEGCVLPERWADETLDRLAKRLSEGVPIEEVNAFARGIAKMVLREARIEERRDREAETLQLPDLAPDVERDAACLERCLRELSADQRTLVERYYFSSSESLAPARKRLAEQLGTTAEALRSRALRIRRQLERCMAECREIENPGDIHPKGSPHINRRGFK
jgi:DNA-directed RNA polymerase specialized sigma24 family protein